MPFIKQWRRGVIADEGLKGFEIYEGGVEPGDRCYVFYKQMVDKWREAPRWATVHEIYRDMVWDIASYSNTDVNDDAARLLAWQVFFYLHVMPYEFKKREENGDI